MVTPVRLEAVPITNTTGTSPVGAKPPGRRALICSKPAYPGAPPANKISAAYPPTYKTTGNTGLGNGAAAGLPAKPDAAVCPSPVAYMVTTEPRAAGLTPEFKVASALTATTRPVPA